MAIQNFEVRQTDALPPDKLALDPAYLQDGIAATEQFLARDGESLGRIFGVTDMNIRVGREWATDLKTGDMTADPRFFIEKGYTPAMAAYATMHEVAAHLREVIQDPALTRDVMSFRRREKAIDAQRGEAASIFHNIFADIAGNNYIHATLDATRETAAQLYATKLFAESDYTESGSLEPRHLQFLYKIIRQEMIPGSDTTVQPEVDEAITAFRNYQGVGDLIAYSTAVAKADRTDMPARERFELWTRVMYPAYLELFEQDARDPAFQSQPAQNGDGQPSPGEPGQPGDTSQPSAGKPDFSKYYEDYHTDKHPDPLDHDQMDKIRREAEKRQRAKEREEREARDPLKQLDKRLQETTGHRLAELKRYQREVDRWRSQIDAMRDIYKLVIDERLATRRRLQGGHTEGAMLNPDTLSQTFIDVRTGTQEPAAFVDYEQHRGERTMTGKTDWVFVFDRSGSMSSGGRSAAAASCAVIGLEGLAAMQRDIETAEEEAGTNLDLDIRTALYTFNEDVHQPKALSHNLTEKERLDAYGEVTSPGGDNADSVVLKMIEGLAIEPDRRKILVVFSDGEADDKTASRASILRLRAKGWQVYGIAIGSEAAEKLYAPDSRRVDDPANLPTAMQTLIEANL